MWPNRIHNDVIGRIIKEDLFQFLTWANKFFINPTGRFVIRWRTSRDSVWLVVRNYRRYLWGVLSSLCNWVPLSGGCDEVDRSASYAARYIARTSLQQVLLRAEVQWLPSVWPNQFPFVLILFSTGTVAESKLEKAARQIFDLRPAGIIQMLDLKTSIYRQTAAYGHMGRTDIDLPWERLDKVDALKEAVNR